MPDPPSIDPMATWRDLVSHWERSVNELANQTMAGSEFSGSINQVMNAALRAQQSMGEVMARYLASLNLPSRTDLEALGGQLAAIESRLGQIAEILERQSSGSAPPSPLMPPRTKRPASEPPP